MARRSGLIVLLVVVALLLASGLPVRATVEMQNEAKKLGFPVKNCLYCHASAHAVEKMKEKARELGMAEGNCLLCHGANIPATLNDRGQWLVDEKTRLKADRIEMFWLKDYVPPKEKAGPEAGVSKPSPENEHRP